MVSTTSQINKFIEFVAVLGDLVILNLVLFFLLFFWGRSFCFFTFLLQGLMDDDFVKSLLSGLFGLPREGLGQSGNSSRSTCIACIEEYYSVLHLLGMYHDF